MKKKVKKFFPTFILTKLLTKDSVTLDGYTLEKIKVEYPNPNYWSSLIHCIFRDTSTGKYYMFAYEHDGIEIQEDTGFYHKNKDGTEVKCTEVKPQAVTVIQYEPIME